MENALDYSYRDRPNETSSKDLSCKGGCLHDPVSDFRYWFNIGIGIILIAGLIVGTYLICHKHKGEKGLWKKIIIWNLLYILIVFALWVLVSYILWRIHLSQIDWI